MKHELVVIFELVSFNTDDRSIVGNPNQKIATLGIKERSETLINERDLPQAAYRDGVDYLVRFFEYREHMLWDYLDSGRGQQAAALIRASINLNR